MSSRRWRPPLAVVLGALFGTLILVAVASVWLFSMSVAGRNTVDLAQDLSNVVMLTIVSRIESHLRPAEAQANYLAQQIIGGAIGPDDPEKLLSTMAASLAASPQTVAVVFVSADGRHFQAGRGPDSIETLANDEVPPGQRSAAAKAMQFDRQFWGELVYIADVGEPVVNLRTPVRRNGDLIGIIAIAVRITALSDFIFDVGQDVDAIAFILHDRDYVLAHPLLTAGFPGLTAENPLPRVSTFTDPVLGQIWAEGWQERDASDLFGNGHISFVGGEPYAYVYREVNNFADKPWLVGLYLRVADVNEPLIRLQQGAIFGLAVAAIALVAVLIVGHRVSRPIRRLARAADAVRSFEFADIEPLAHTKIRETDDAGQAFNAMIHGLRWFESYVPKTLVTRLMRQGSLDQLKSEFRSLSVLFTDIRGFTTMAENMSAPDTAAFLNHHFDLVAACIEAEEGTVDKYIGDSVMAFWGAPERQADHGPRACRAALAIRDAIDRDNAERTANGLPPVRIRIGIHTGKAVVGNIGSRSRVNYTPVGDSVNTANRVEEMAKEMDLPDEDVHILISADTVADLPKDGFTLVPMGRRDVRGRERGLEIFRL